MFIHWIVIYPTDSAIHRLSNRGLTSSAAFDTSTEYLFHVWNWRKRESQRQIQNVCMVYKSLNGLAPHYLRSRFVQRSTITGYSLRNTAVSLPRTNFLKNSFRYSGAVLWNSLPTHLRQAGSLASSFKYLTFGIFFNHYL